MHYFRRHGKSSSNNFKHYKKLKKIKEVQKEPLFIFFYYPIKATIPHITSIIPKISPATANPVPLLLLSLISLKLMQLKINPGVPTIKGNIKKATKLNTNPVIAKAENGFCSTF